LALLLMPLTNALKFHPLATVGTIAAFVTRGHRLKAPQRAQWWSAEPTTSRWRAAASTTSST
jgi:hypothetical protein